MREDSRTRKWRQCAGLGAMGRHDPGGDRLSADRGGRSEAGSGPADVRPATVLRAVGEMFRKARVAFNLTQEQVAELTSDRPYRLSRSAIGAIERGDHQPGLTALIGLTRVLQIDPLQVLETAETFGPPRHELDGASREDLDRQATDLFWSGDFLGALSRYDTMLRLLLLEPATDTGKRSHLACEIELRRAGALRRCGAWLAARGAAERAISYAGSSPELQARAFTVLCEIHLELGQTALAELAARRAVELASGCAAEVHARASNARGRALERIERFREAREAYETARDLFRTSGDTIELILAEGRVGLCHVGLGQIKAAARAFQRAVDLARRHAAAPLEAQWLVELGRVALVEGRLSAAESLALAAHRIAKPREDALAIFRAEWLRHLVVRGRDPVAPDRNRLAALRKLLLRLGEHRTDRDVMEFRAEAEGLAAKETERP